MKRPPAQAARLAHAYVLATLPADVRQEDNARKARRSAEEGPTILIVDEDLGFLYWLGCTLSAAGYLPLPALKCEDARDLSQGLSVRIDLLVMDCSLAGASELVAELAHFYPQLKVIAAIGDRKEPEPGLKSASANASRFGTPCEDDTLEVAWLETIRAVIASDHIDNRCLLRD